MNARIKVLSALTAVFLAPLLLAWAVYHQPAWHPSGGLQHGELLQPVQTLVPLRLKDSRGRLLDEKLFQGHWSLLYRTAGACEQECRAMLDTLQRVRLAQGTAMGRVQRILVLSHAVGSAPAGSDLKVAVSEQWPLPSGSVYLLNPQGRLVLRYRPGFAPQGLLDDLHRLLRMAGEA